MRAPDFGGKSGGRSLGQARFRQSKPVNGLMGGSPTPHPGPDSGIARLGGPSPPRIPPPDRLQTHLSPAAAPSRFELPALRACAASSRRYLVESAIGGHLLNTAESDMQVYCWRNASCEVDFVLRCRSRIVSFKVKSGAKSQSLRGLAEFECRFRPYRSWLVGTGGVPLGEFLSKPAHHWFG